ncbi:hypothetical protein FSP39_001209 [Pinctada imbricata]|uniref:Mab-21-like HhH/H2TH-like domain-containing protein n=1 Tax=Pinctada imbricata TaxID=66713 RepID=A0AA89C038_PINIB|nr:hypothetical protein FSP39_001209 [Pinctada imbricata]
MKELISRGVSINSKDNNDDTPLHIMATIACKKSIEFLLDNNGANIQARNRGGESALHYLAGSNELKGFKETLSLLLDRGMDINDIDFEGRNAIHHALMSKDTDRSAIDEFLTRGIDINVEDRRGRNEIFHAVKHSSIFEFDEEDIDRRVDVIKCLSENGVDVSKGDMYGITALHEATLKNSLDILLVLLESGADLAKQTKTGATPLHWACKIYNMTHLVLYFCIENKVDINIKDIHGCTPLHWAMWYRQKSVVQTLLQTGCDYTITDDNGETPLDLAQKMRFDGFRELLENNLYEHLEELNLEYPALKCIEKDPVMACPLLRYIKKAEDTLSIEEYIGHLDTHYFSLKDLINTVVSSDDMGFIMISKKTKLLQKWISCTYLEQTTVRNIPRHLKKGYIILKALIESGYFPSVVDHDNDKAVKKYISSYLLKTCFLHEIQSTIGKIGETEASKDDRKISIDMANRTVLRLEKCVNEKFVPSYFNRGKNLLGISGTEDGIREQSIYLQLIGLMKHIIRIIESDDDYLQTYQVIYSRN